VTRIHVLGPGLHETAGVLGGKGFGLAELQRLGLPVPAGFVIAPSARDDLSDAELTTAVRDLEEATGRRFGGPERPLVVAVRSGAAVSMPGMMSTVLNLGLTAEAAAGLAAETGDPSFVADARRGLLAGLAAAGVPEVPDDADAQLRVAVRAVFASWDTPRAVTYRELHGIPHDLGTAVVVQAMVFGNRDDRSGSGVAFSRDPSTGVRVPFGEVAFRGQGEEVVAGRSATRPLSDLAAHPAVWSGLRAALDRIERHYRDACHVEFTFESGRLWFLQVRSGGLVGRAAVRVAVDLVDEGLIDRETAVRRISPRDLRSARTPRMNLDAAPDVLARGRGASPGVAVGRIAVTADRAARMAADGPVVLVRPHTSPLDMHGLAAAQGIVTIVGGPTSHAAVVARSLRKPAVVQATGLTVDDAAGCVRAGDRMVAEGELVTIDGIGGEVVLGDPGTVPAETDRHLGRLLAWAGDLGCQAI
jgi:pyruvate,orthophosphate dikinase